jgi:hypothetical protein
MAHGAVVLLLGAPIIFLAVGLGGALAIFFQNSLEPISKLRVVADGL